MSNRRDRSRDNRHFQFQQSVGNSVSNRGPESVAGVKHFVKVFKSRILSLISLSINLAGDRDSRQIVINEFASDCFRLDGVTFRQWFEQFDQSLFDHVVRVDTADFVARLFAQTLHDQVNGPLNEDF